MKYTTKKTTYDIRHTIYDGSGFTLVEVLFVIAIVSVLLVAITPYLRAFHVSWESADKRNEVVQNARAGMDKMLKELREADEFTAISKRSVSFNDVDDTNITYTEMNDYLTRNGEILAGMVAGVNDLGFDFYDITGKKTSQEEDVKAVEISLTISDPDDAVSPVVITSMVYIRSTPVSGEGYILSKNSDFSTEDTVFSTSDIFYIKVWTDQVDYTDLDYATCQLKKGGTKVNFSLTNNGDETYTGSQDLSGFASGSWAVNMSIKDNDSPAGRYTPTSSITIG